MHWIVYVEGERSGTAFRARPKRLTTGRGLVWRKIEQQLTNLIRKLILPVKSGPFNTVGKVVWFIGDQGGLQMKLKLNFETTKQQTRMHISMAAHTRTDSKISSG